MFLRYALIDWLLSRCPAGRLLMNSYSRRVKRQLGLPADSLMPGVIWSLDSRQKRSFEPK